MTYEKRTENGKTVFVPKDQAAVPVPPMPKKKPKVYKAKKIGKQYGERKNWW